jgi:DNA replication protein DnaC
MNSQTTTPPTDLASQLAQLGLHLIASQLDDFIARATTKRWSPRSLLDQLARQELEERARRSLERRLKSSRLGRFKPISDFDWHWPKKVDRPLIEAALTLEFIPEGRNFILLGANGLGKTMIAKNVAHTAVLAGYKVLFTTATDLLDHLDVDSPELRRRRLRHCTQPSLLTIDEVGYLAYDDHAADLLYSVVNARYEARRSVLLTTNLAFKNWNTVFPNATCIATLLDRLTHHADVTLIEGNSYRVRESEQEANSRKQRRHNSRS